MAESNDYARKIAKIAMPDMVKYGVAPTPENYALWYLYATGRNPQLVDTINSLKEAKAEFTPETNLLLYEAYITLSKLEQEVQRYNMTAQNLMSDLNELISVMNTETTAYNEKLGAYLQHMTGRYNDQNLTKMVQMLVDKTQEMRDSGQMLTARLDESRREVGELRENLEKISEEANRDTLTGVGNRKVFEKQMTAMIEDAKEGKNVLSLLIIDIDHFKQFNDKFGHQVGDEVLKIVARELIKSVRGRDIVARYGGEEFVVLLPETPLLGALAVAENIRKSIASRELTRKGTKETYGNVTISIGGAEFHPPKDTAHEFLKRADEALYRSKKGGRNRVTQESYTIEES